MLLYNIFLYQVIDAASTVVYYYFVSSKINYYAIAIAPCLSRNSTKNNYCITHAHNVSPALSRKLLPQ